MPEKKVFTHSFVKKEDPFQAIEVKSFDKVPERPKLVRDRYTVGIAGNNTEGAREIENEQSRPITVYRKIKLIHSPTDPLTPMMKQRIERAVRQSFPVRIAMHLREYSAYRKQKLVIDLIPSDKAVLSQTEQAEKIKTLTTQHSNLLKEYETRDNNVGLPEKLKTLAWQSWQFGRNCLIILYEDGSTEKISTLFQINSRRMGEPILNEEQNLKFEGCVIDGTGLDKNSMIYAVYQDREISPHTESYGYSITELILVEAETHNFMIQNLKEVSLSAFLPTILLKIDTENTGPTEKSQKVSNIIGSIEPGKVIGVPTDVEESVMLDMKPDYAGYVSTMDSLEMKIYNAFHVPLFLVKSDEIANRATANKSAKLFFDGVVTDDQLWMEELLGRQWYDPLLREDLKKGTLKGEEVIETKVDTSEPQDKEAPLPFLIRRKFELPTVEDFLDLAEALVSLKSNHIWDTAKANQILNTEDVTSRVVEEEKKDKEIEKERMEANLENAKLQQKSTKEIAIASRSLQKRKEEILKQLEDKVNTL